MKLFDILLRVRGVGMVALCAAGLCMPVNFALAQSEAPLRILVPYSAGSPVDTYARMMSEYMRPLLGPIVVVNKPGAGGIVGVQDVLAGPRDGTLALWAAGSLFGTNPFVFRKLPYTLDQFEPIANVVELCLVFSARPGLGVKTVDELVSKMKAEPGQVRFASPGIGNQPVLAWEKFVRHIGATALSVPYKSTPDVTLGMLGGFSDVTVGVMSGPDLDNFRSGKMVPLAVTCKNRMPQLPDVQTMAEAGYPEMSITGTVEVFYAKGVPAPALDRLSKAIEDTKRNPEFVKKLEALNAQPAPTTNRADFRHWLDADRQVWSQIAKDANIVIDN
ncbi:MAG: tripartite tricarboxylate transporter substrate binding protein [Gammaproteobacteria bacterium]|nr:tripartite tricarboxylate transporter substrate binding protein [Gammaproteobacteria bacterium]MBU1441592.1 tripartite tricarboxylate transporter substrate binding protein [Gammaproteobacteria bacterium]MBU2286126.1 tripartite tricarboxylate transporter substrate binding protein [Gammaproteobacteria bacterium]MBU2410431.1 tripartite tricarboxylate transporter substrate binding protein [Gammaproteobacteria bacterium]